MHWVGCRLKFSNRSVTDLLYIQSIAGLGEPLGATCLNLPVSLGMLNIKYALHLCGRAILYCVFNTTYESHFIVPLIA